MGERDYPNSSIPEDFEKHLIHIEFIDTKFTGTITVYPILTASHPDAINKWNNVEKDVENILKGHNGTRVHVLLSELKWDAIRPCVLVFSPDAETDAFRENVLERLRSTLSPIYSVLPLYSRSDIFGASIDSHVRMSGNLDYVCLNPGVSIRIRGEPGGGTLGGKVSIKKGGQIKDFGISNHHILVWGKKNALTPSDVVHKSRSRIAVSPSDIDHSDSFETVQKELQEANVRYLGTGGQMWSKLRAELDPREVFAKRAKTDEAKFKELKDEEERMRGFNRSIRPVLYPSGLSHTTGPSPLQLDWALTEITAPCGIENTTRRPLPGHGFGSFNVGETVTAWTDLREGQKVVKTGRTTGWTRGTVSAI